MGNCHPRVWTIVTYTEILIWSYCSSSMYYARLWWCLLLTESVEWYSDFTMATGFQGVSRDNITFNTRGNGCSSGSCHNIRSHEAVSILYCGRHSCRSKRPWCFLGDSWKWPGSGTKVLGGAHMRMFYGNSTKVLGGANMWMFYGSSTQVLGRAHMRMFYGCGIWWSTHVNVLHE